MADPLLAMIGAFTLAVLGVIAVVSIAFIAGQAGIALARFVCKQFRF